jgi:ArsR family transcriptional regulator, arsenate/arsenite/antimonite-responsive transcriptional repressor
MSNYRNDDIEKLSETFKALSSPYRLRIFLRLASCSINTEGPANDYTDAQICECVGALGKDLGIAPSTVSHHIKELHRSGLIKMRRHGQSVECWVDPQVFDSVAVFFKQPMSV